MNVHCCMALLALCSLTAADPDPGCEELLQPVDDRRLVGYVVLGKLSGKWIFYAGTSDNKEIMQDLKMVDSSRIELSVAPDNGDMTLSWADKVNGSCYYGKAKSVILRNNTQVTYHYNSSTSVHVGRLLVTCPDCLVWTGTVMKGTKEKKKIIFIFTKTGTLDASHFEVFKKQAACLNFPKEFQLIEATDLCPDAPDAEEQEQEQTH